MGSEPPPVADLVRLGAGGEVGACGAALVVHHPGGRLVQHALAGRADGECKVGVFVVGRRVARVEAAHLSEQRARRSEEHTSELPSLMRISYAVFCLKKKKKNQQTQTL